MLRPTYVDPCLDLSDAIRKFKYAPPLTWKTERSEAKRPIYYANEPRPIDHSNLHFIRSAQAWVANRDHYEPIGDEV